MTIIIEDNKKPEKIVQYKGFILDPFQVDAIESIEKGNSVVVSAGTGTGKTLIADYLIDKYIKENKRIIYTAPIKALSNQKFRDFRKQYGNKVGLMTGDITINHDAQIQIMTTEIYRNMLINKEYFDDLAYVIFDEVHYINDIERGTIWEEAIIFSPKHVRFLCLSATIPNAEEFARWIKKIHKHEVDVIVYNKRAVPLEHYVFTDFSGIKSARRFDISQLQYKIEELKSKRKKKRKKDKEKSQISFANVNSLINILKQKDWLPAIVFSFSRKRTWNIASQISKDFNFLDESTRVSVLKYFDEKINATDENLWDLDSVVELRKLVSKGIAVHNAGLLPVLKEIVEVLFAEGKIKVLSATETFALGINMPARSVVFTDLRKWDGRNFRPLLAREYFQMAGRAGRRGIDKIGYVITMLNETQTFYTLKEILNVKSEPIESQFKLSYNTILNLIKDLDLKQAKKVLKQSFAYFQSRGRDAYYNRIIREFMRKYDELKKLNYVSNDKPTEKGLFAARIYTEEIAITELIFDNIIHALSDDEFLVIIASLVYEPRITDRFNMKNINKEVKRILNKIRMNEYLKKRIKETRVKKMYKITTWWYYQKEFEELLDITNLAEGDIIRLFRQIIDVLRQIIKASYDTFPSLAIRIERLIEKIDRDVVAVKF